MEEIWKDIKGYEGLYQVSNLGNVKSLNYKRWHKEKIMNMQINKGGYYTISLHKDKKEKRFLVHRLVAEAFIPNIYNLPQINHKDENSLNNNYKNLEWCNQGYNNNYGNHNEKMIKSLSKRIKQYDKNNNFIKEWMSMIIASKELNINSGNICCCCKGRKKTAGGYIWRYAK